VAMVTLIVRFLVVWVAVVGVGVWGLYLSYVATGSRGFFGSYLWRVVRGVFDSAR
jgi:hypothetical protein